MNKFSVQLVVALRCTLYYQSPQTNAYSPQSRDYYNQMRQHIDPCPTASLTTVSQKSSSVEEATILSTPEEPSRVTNGCTVTSSLIQEGVSISRGGIVSESLLMEHSHVKDHAKVYTKQYNISRLRYIQVLYEMFEHSI